LILNEFLFEKYIVIWCFEEYRNYLKQ